MSLGHALDSLAARWAADPDPTTGAALADGLRKRGELAQARALLERAVDQFPGAPVLLLTRARVAQAQGDREAVARDLARVLADDPTHPVARGLATTLAPEVLTAVDAAEADPEPPLDGWPDDDSAGTEPHEASAHTPVLVTESLAALYHRQGHLELAAAAYLELAERQPDNLALRTRHEAVRRELASSRPIPFDSRVSGGESAAAWLARVASARTVPLRARTGFDAFYEPPPAPAQPEGDFDAFQRWLEELDR